MVNDPHSAHAYHEHTKHSFESVRANAHRLLWEIQPLPLKIYPQLAPIPLPRDVGRVAVSTLEAIARAELGASGILDVVGLARLLHFSAGIMKERVYGDRRVYFRAAPCTGALYHIDVYVVCERLPGGSADELPAGVYHFGPHDFALRRLRPGDHRGAVLAATADEPSVQRAPAVLVFASTFWRNAWKYQSRAYRHCWWDSGTMMAQLLAVAAAERLPARVVTGFVDRDVHGLLGLDESREAALALVTVGTEARSQPPRLGEVAPLDLETLPLSSREIDYPAIREAHAGSSLPDADSVRRWRERGHAGAASSGGSRATGPDTTGTGAGLETLPLAGLDPAPQRALDRTIAGRGSTRHFAHAPIASEALGTMLERSLAPVSFDARAELARAFDDVYLILNAVDGAEAGAYALSRGRDGDAPESGVRSLQLEPLRLGSFRREAGYLGLGQDIPADAAADVYFLSALDPLLELYGARGYRLAQLEAAIHGGRLYLAAYALGLGASGLTFFDDDVTEFFSPHAAGKSVMFLVAVGVPRRRAAGRVR